MKTTPAQSTPAAVGQLGIGSPRVPVVRFGCMECGHKFKTVKAAERASFGPNGCPKCGGADIDMVVP